MMLDQLAFSAAARFGLQPDLRDRMERDPDRHGPARPLTTGGTHLVAYDVLAGDQCTQEGCNAACFMVKVESLAIDHFQLKHSHGRAPVVSRENLLRQAPSQRCSA